MHIESAEADAILTSLLDRVEAGEDVTITRGGKPVARLISVERKAEQDGSDPVGDLLCLRERFRGRGITRDEIHDWIAEARR
jgi:prevent-host-death family protein